MILDRLPRVWAKVLFLVGGAAILPAAETVPGRWPEERANAWYAATPWPVGANYLPRTAINQLEMWQADTFDPATIDQEFGWAERIGFNTMRVFLHDLLWQGDAEAFLRRVDQFLGIAAKHRIKILFVFFDGVWDPHPYAGKQRPPRPFVHNSGWVQSPGREILRDPARYEALKPYIQGVLRRFKDDQRILGWDLFNEPDNLNSDAYGGLELPNKAELALKLLARTFAWAREVAPSQPLTAGIWLDYEGWKKNPPIYQYMLANSDFITFHNYAPPDDMAREVAELRARFRRPLICTEYMARGARSTFDPILGDLKQARVGALNWGLVDGKSQTIYPWETWKKIHTGEPALWHHDVFRADGSPYRQTEVDYIRRVTGR
ncbi:MAG: cellulase family glycosylhydrolase [Verrucomicrobia bacterium]|nr:cellulase family glycosylhydrolase [Verrucomicrobiota bacterium]